MEKTNPTIDVKFKDLRVAVVALNESKLLKTSIKLVGISKEQILKDFLAGFDTIEDVDGKFPGPKAALDFYNGVLDLTEKAKTGTAPAPPAATGKKKEKTPGSAPAKKKEPAADKGPGVIATILELVKKGGKTKAEILDALCAAFPDREKEKMAKTVQVQIGGKKETRLEKEKGIKIKVSEDGKYSIAKK